MNDQKQEQQKLSTMIDEKNQTYEWSTTRVAEGVVINAVSYLVLGLLALVGGLIYAAGALLFSALHTPEGLTGILALLFLGAVLMVVVLVIVLVAWIRGMKSQVLAGMLIGAAIGAGIGAMVQRSGKWDLNLAKTAAEMQAQTQKDTQTNP